MVNWNKSLGAIRRVIYSFAKENLPLTLNKRLKVKYLIPRQLFLYVYQTFRAPTTNKAVISENMDHVNVGQIICNTSEISQLAQQKDSLSNHLNVTSTCFSFLLK